MMSTYLIVLLIAPAQWMLMWCGVYIEKIRLKNLKLIIGFADAFVASAGIVSIQSDIYRARTGKIPINDNYLVTIILAECIISVAMLLLWAIAARRKAATGRNS